MSDIHIDLGAERVALRCTLRAAKELNAFFGNFTSGFRRLTEYDFSAYVAVVAFGSGRQAKDIEAAVFEAGLPQLVKPLSDYLALLANGGRPVETEAAKKTGEG